MFSMLLLAFPLPAVGPQFDQPMEITRGLERPSALCFGDFDGDGFTDLIGSSSASGKLRLWRGDGTGGFDRGTSIQVALSSVVGMSVGDLDGDGDLDLALASPGPSVDWVENLGGGEFAGGMPLAGFGAVLPGSIVRHRIVDFDGNGTNDVLMTFDRSSTGQDSLVLLASSLGGGAFQALTLIESPSALHDAEAADLDGDGDRDIVVGGTGVGAWYRNDGAGTFFGPIPLPLFPGAIDEQVGVGDFDGDGDLDLVSIQCISPLLSASVTVSTGDGAGGFTAQSPVSLSSCTLSFLVEDVNGDGRADLLAAGQLQSVLDGRLELAVGLASGGLSSPALLLSGERAFTAAGFGDADGDGTLEVAAGADGGQVFTREFLPGTAPPVLGSEGAELTETVMFVFADRLIDVADFNGDGLPDVCVSAVAEQKIGWWPADGTGGFAPLETVAAQASSRGDVYVGDVDGDGAEDVVERLFATGAYRWYRGDGAGTFAAAAPVSIPFFLFGADGLLDVDSDGLVDLVYLPVSSPAQLAWSRNLGAGVPGTANFGARTIIDTVQEPIYAPRLRDVTGNGLLDLAFIVRGAIGASPKFAYYGATGPGVFSSTRTEFDLFAPFPLFESSTWDAADMDGDGEIDLVTSLNAAFAPARNRLMIYRGLGAGQFSAVSVFAGATQSAEGLELADLDGDGRPDVVYLLPLVPGEEDGLVWYRNLTGTQFAPRVSLASSRALFSAFLLGDYDGDGDLDAVFAEHGNDSIVRIETLYRGEIGIPYCSASVPNSTGQIGEMSAFGSAIPGAGDLTLGATALPLQSFGLFLASQTTGAMFAMNSVGVLCLGGGIGRFSGPGQIISSGVSGSISIDVQPSSLPTPQGPAAALAGQTWHFQAWHRDTAAGQATSNFTRAVSVRFL